MPPGVKFKKCFLFCHAAKSVSRLGVQLLVPLILQAAGTLNSISPSHFLSFEYILRCTKRPC